jgi:hypothetical protein
LRDQCTPSHRGRTVTIGTHEALLQAARAEQATPEWGERYRADRPTVERKISHFVRRPWGGRNARVRGRRRVFTDALARAAAVNLARLATLGLTHDGGTWAIAAG